MEWTDLAGPVVWGVLVCLFLYKYISIYGLPFRKKITREGMSVYDVWRDKQQYRRYADKIYDMLEDDYAQGLISGAEFCRWEKRFSWMPDFKPTPMVPIKEAIRQRLKTRYQLRDEVRNDYHGRKVRLYDNLDQVHRKYFPTFQKDSVPSDKPRLTKRKSMFPHFFGNGSNVQSSQHLQSA